MSQQQNSNPGDEAPELEPQQTGRSAQQPVEGGEQDESNESQGQSSEAPATG